MAARSGTTLRVKSAVRVTVKGWLAVPALVVTLTMPEVAPSGTVVVIVVRDIECRTAGVPLNATRVVRGSKRAPPIVTTAPTAPASGVTLAIVGPRVTVNCRIAGVG